MFELDRGVGGAETGSRAGGDIGREGGVDMLAPTGASGVLG